MTSLREVFLGKTLTTIDSGAFQYDSALTNLFIPSSVTVINGAAFLNCTCTLEVTWAKENTPSDYSKTWDGQFGGTIVYGATR